MRGNLRFPFTKLGWGGGIRTPECMDQNHVPYHLATPHRVGNPTTVAGLSHTSNHAVFKTQFYKYIVQ